MILNWWYWVDRHTKYNKQIYPKAFLWHHQAVFVFLMAKFLLGVLSVWVNGFCRSSGQLDRIILEALLFNSLVHLHTFDCIIHLMGSFIKQIKLICQVTLASCVPFFNQLTHYEKKKLGPSPLYDPLFYSEYVHFIQTCEVYHFKHRVCKPYQEVSFFCN